MTKYTKLTNLAVKDSVQLPGVPQWRVLGSIDYRAASGSPRWMCLLPSGETITSLVCVVEKAFNSGTSDVLVLGVNEDDDLFMNASDITPGIEGSYLKNTVIRSGTGDVNIRAKLTKTGTNATAGRATFYGLVAKF